MRDNPYTINNSINNNTNKMNSHLNEMRSKTNPNKTIKVDYSSTIKKLQLREDNSTCFDCGCKV